MIRRLVTINAGVEKSDPVANLLMEMGFKRYQVAPFPGPPGDVADTTVALGAGANVSLVEPLSDRSPIRRFLDKKGEGYASLTFEVDDLDETMARWEELGIEWWQPRPHVYENARFGDVRAEQARVNWTSARSMHGLALEVVEFRGEVVPRTDFYE